MEGLCIDRNHFDLRTFQKVDHAYLPKQCRLSCSLKIVRNHEFSDLAQSPRENSVVRKAANSRADVDSSLGPDYLSQS